MAHSFFTNLKYCLYLDSILLIQLSYPVPVSVSYYIIPVALEHILIFGTESPCSFIFFFIDFIAILAYFFYQMSAGQFLLKNYLGIWIWLIALICRLIFIILGTQYLMSGIDLLMSFSRVFMFSSHRSCTFCLWYIGKLLRFARWSLDFVSNHLTEFSCYFQ